MMAIICKNLNPQPPLSLNPSSCHNEIVTELCPSWTAVCIAVCILFQIQKLQTENNIKPLSLECIKRELTDPFLQQLFQQFECSKDDSGRKVVASIKENKKYKMANRTEERILEFARNLLPAEDYSDLNLNHPFPLLSTVPSRRIRKSQNSESVKSHKRHASSN